MNSGLQYTVTLVTLFTKCLAADILLPLFTSCMCYFDSNGMNGIRHTLSFWNNQHSVLQMPPQTMYVRIAFLRLRNDCMCIYILFVRIFRDGPWIASTVQCLSTIYYQVNKCRNQLRLKRLEKQNTSWENTKVMFM